MSGIGRLTLPDVQEWSGDPTGYSGVVKWPSRCTKVVGRPCWMSGSGRKTLPDVLE